MHFVMRLMNFSLSYFIQNFSKGFPVKSVFRKLIKVLCWLLLLIYVTMFPVDTRRRFNVDTTSCNVAQRRINVETTSCVYWTIPSYGNVSACFTDIIFATIKFSLIHYWWDMARPVFRIK